jgi:hypothetical protein
MQENLSIEAGKSSLPYQDRSLFDGPQKVRKNRRCDLTAQKLGDRLEYCMLVSRPFPVKDATQSSLGQLPSTAQVSGSSPAGASNPDSISESPGDDIDRQTKSRIAPNQNILLGFEKRSTFSGPNLPALFETNQELESQLTSLQSAISANDAETERIWKRTSDLRLERNA